MTTSTSGPADAAREPWPRSRRGEFALILVVAIAQVGGTTLAATHQSGTIGGAGYLFLGGAAVVLVGRRRYPVGVLLASCAFTLAYSVSRAPRGPIYFALIAASVSAVVAGQRRVVIGVLIVGYVAFQWLPPLVGTHPGPSALAAFLVGAWLLVLWLGAEWIRGRTLRLSALARSREEEVRRLASDERLRIARELHDVLAHDISLINVQASSALHLIDRQPERAREALAAIKEVSKDALVELRGPCCRSARSVAPDGSGGTRRRRHRRAGGDARPGPRRPSGRPSRPQRAPRRRPSRRTCTAGSSATVPTPPATGGGHRRDRDETTTGRVPFSTPEVTGGGALCRGRAAGQAPRRPNWWRRSDAPVESPSR